ncbi:MAG: hypothetical protein PHN80_03800 [Hespellia sp.]|nr:hypothetical protein [Hespellia sp.]
MNHRIKCTLCHAGRVAAVLCMALSLRMGMESEASGLELFQTELFPDIKMNYKMKIPEQCEEGAAEGEAELTESALLTLIDSAKEISAENTAETSSVGSEKVESDHWAGSKNESESGGPAEKEGENNSEITENSVNVVAESKPENSTEEVDGTGTENPLEGESGSNLNDSTEGADGSNSDNSTGDANGSNSEKPADEEDKNNPEIPKFTINEGFIVDAGGVIAGFDSESVVLDEGYLELPSSGCNGIGPEAFSMLGEAVYELYIPGNITDIQAGAFRGLENLEWIEMETNESFCSVDGVIYSTDLTILYAFPSGRTGTFLLPETVTHIAPGAFENAKLEQLDIRQSRGLVLDDESNLEFGFEIIGDE